MSFPGKGDKVLTIEAECDLETLQGLILSTSEDDILLEGIRYGFPPQSVTFKGNENKTLEQLGISNGEKIIVNLTEVGKPVATSPMKHPDASQVHKQGNQKDSKASGASSKGVWIDSRRLLQVHDVPDDNSCLFHAISYAVYKDISLSSEIRRIVAAAVRKDTIKYSDAILGRPNHEYSEWILKPTSWGGGIEIAILSNHLKYAIYVLDVDACKYEKFNEQLYDQFIIIAYNGVHYDTVEILDGSYHQTVFDIREKDSQFLLQETLKVAREMKREGKTFNTTRDSILCNTCGTTLIGEREVSKHAEKTGHVDFRQK